MPLHLRESGTQRCPSRATGSVLSPAKIFTRTVSSTFTQSSHGDVLRLLYDEARGLHYPNLTFIADTKHLSLEKLYLGAADIFARNHRIS